MYIIWSLDLCQRCRCDGLGKDHLSFQEEMLDREKKKKKIPNSHYSKKSIPDGF